MEQQNRESLEPWIPALLKMTSENLLQPTYNWWEWIRALSTAEFKRMLIRILSTLPLNQPIREVMLDLLGTTAGEMTPQEIKTWSAEILLARNRLLMARQPIHNPPSPDSHRE